jgi:hypothetical protein
LSVGITWKEGRVTEVRLDVPRARVVKLRCDTPLRLAEYQPEEARFSPTDEPGLGALNARVPGTYRLRADV